MISNNRVIKEICKLLENRKIRTLSKVILYVTILLITGLIIQYVETNFSLSRKTHEYLKLREIEDGSIRNAFITLSIGVLSIGSIMFTLLIGKIQSLVNEVNYSSFHRKTYVDGKTLDNYVLLMSVSIVLLLIYLVADISAYPITYMIILLFAFFTVVYILSTLFTSLLDDLNLFRILEKNFKSITLRFNEFKNSHKELERLLDSRMKIAANQKGKRKLLKFDMRIKSLRDDLEMLSNLHYSECKQSVEELDYIVVTACRRKDPELLRATLDFTNTHIKHHLEVLDYPIDKSIKFWSNYSLGRNYSYINDKCLPIYENSELNKSEQNLVEIAHNNFTALMFEYAFLKPGGQEIDDSDFRLMFDKYYAMTIKCIHNGLHSVIFRYYLSINFMIESIQSDSIEKLLQISSNNISLTEELITASKARDCMYVFIIQSKIMRITISNEIYRSSNYFAWSDFFEMFEKYIGSIDSSKSNYIMSVVSSCIDNDEHDSISQILADVFINLDTRLDGIESLGGELNLTSIILKLLESKHISISKAIRIDERVFFGFASILNQIMNILRKYMSFQKTSYHNRLMEKSLKQYCDYLLVYNGYDNWRAFTEMEETFNKLFHDSHVKEIAVIAYVDLINRIVNHYIAISKQDNKIDIPFKSTIDIEGIIIQMYGFENNLYELLLGQIELTLSNEEYDFLLDHINNLITELNTELTDYLKNYESSSEINKPEFKRSLSSLIDLFMDVNQTYNDNME